MSLIFHASLRGRMLRLIGGVVVLAFVITITSVAYLSEANARRSALAIAQQTAKSEALRINDELNRVSAAVHALAAGLAGIQENGQFKDRGLPDNLMKRILEENPNYLGVWNVWEPDAFDKKDASYVNAPGHDASGRYVAYWNRVGGVHLEACTDYDKQTAGDYYMRPLKSAKEVAMEPVVYKINNQDVMVVSLCMPIILGQKVMGVAGIDISMERFQSMISQIKPYETGYGFLLAGNGAFVSAPDAKLIGKLSSETNQDPNLIQACKMGTEYIVTTDSSMSGERCLIVGEPIRIGQTTTPWMLGVATPEQKMLEASNRLVKVCVIIGGISVLAVLALIWIVSHSLAKPVMKIADGLHEFADQLAASANEVSKAGNTMAQGASESAAALEETSSSMHEITSMISRNAESSSKASHIVSDTAHMMEGTQQNLEKLKLAMDQISSSGKETQRIVLTIDEIAFQTNILALNAAVEAARAGSAGAGFAVVADEVRNLAQRAASAAKDTSSLIESSVSNISSANEITGRAKGDFTQVNESSKQLADFIQQIAQDSIQQRQGIKEVGKAIDELNQVVQRNAALAEESSASSEELNAQAAHLQNYAHQLSALVRGGRGGSTAGSPS